MRQLFVNAAALGLSSLACVTATVETVSGTEGPTGSSGKDTAESRSEAPSSPTPGNEDESTAAGTTSDGTGGQDTEVTTASETGDGTGGSSDTGADACDWIDGYRGVVLDDGERIRLFRMRDDNYPLCIWIDLVMGGASPYVALATEPWVFESAGWHEDIEACNTDSPGDVGGNYITFVSGVAELDPAFTPCTVDFDGDVRLSDVNPTVYSEFVATIPLCGC